MLKGILSNVYAEIDNWGVAGTSSVMLLILGISLLILGPNVEPAYATLGYETTRVGLIMSGLFLSGFGVFGISRKGITGTSSVMLLILGISLLILGPNVEPVYVSLSGETTRIGLIMSGLFLSGFGGFGIARQMGISISIRYER